MAIPTIKFYNHIIVASEIVAIGIVSYLREQNHFQLEITLRSGVQFVTPSSDAFKSANEAKSELNDLFERIETSINNTNKEV